MPPLVPVDPGQLRGPGEREFFRRIAIDGQIDPQIGTGTKEITEGIVHHRCLACIKMQQETACARLSSRRSLQRAEECCASFRLAHTFGLWHNNALTTSLSTRTICCKVQLDNAADGALRQTQRAFNQAATYCASVAWAQGPTNTNTLHKLVYGPTRACYGLGAQLACCARDKAAEAVRRARQDKRATCPTFRDASSIRYDARTYRLKSLDRVSLNIVQGRVVGQLVLGS